jgi:spore germination cell wall hydrolase CwlJ-like protein
MVSAASVPTKDTVHKAVVGVSLLLMCITLLAKPLSAEMRCMADNLHWEAKVDGVVGMAAVASVVMNRVASPHYPNTVCKVVYQRKQFSWTLYKALRRQKLKHDWQTLMVATLALKGQLIDKTGGATHYHAMYVKPYWAETLPFTVQIGTHLFYKDET